MCSRVSTLDGLYVDRRSLNQCKVLHSTEKVHTIDRKGGQVIVLKISDLLVLNFDFFTCQYLPFFVASFP